MARRAASQVVTAAEARDHFDEIVKRTAAGGEPIVVEDEGVPSVIIVSLPQYEELLREARLARFEHASRAAGLAAVEQGLTEEQLEREIEEIKRRRHQQCQLVPTPD